MSRVCYFANVWGGGGRYTLLFTRSLVSAPKESYSDYFQSEFFYKESFIDYNLLNLYQIIFCNGALYM